MYEDERKVNQEYLENLSEWIEEYYSVQISPEELNDVLMGAITIQDGYDKQYYENETTEED
jgi:hypothetical protein